MPGTHELLYSLYGAWRLIRLDPGGMGYFNHSVAGFWRSFFAAVIIAPFYLGWSVLQYGAEPDAAGGTSGAPMVAIDSLRYLAGWVAFPLTMLVVARFLDRGGHFSSYIIAMNWAAVPQWLVVMAVFALVQLAGGAASGVIHVAALAVMLFYDYYIARIALEISTGQAIAVTVIGLLVALILDAVVFGLV